MGWLEGRHDPVQHQKNAADKAKPPAAPLAQPLPDEPAAADLEQSGYDEEEDRCGEELEFHL